MRRFRSILLASAAVCMLAGPSVAQAPVNTMASRAAGDAGPADPVAHAELASALDRLSPGLSDRARWSVAHRSSEAVPIDPRLPDDLTDRFEDILTSAGIMQGTRDDVRLMPGNHLVAHDFEVDAGNGRSLQAKTIRIAPGIIVLDEAILLDSSGSLEALRLLFLQSRGAGPDGAALSLAMDGLVLSSNSYAPATAGSGKTGFSSSLQADYAVVVAASGVQGGGESEAEPARFSFAVSDLTGSARFAGMAELSVAALRIDAVSNYTRLPAGARPASGFLPILLGLDQDEQDSLTALLEAILTGAMRIDRVGNDLSASVEGVSFRAWRSEATPPAGIDIDRMSLGVGTASKRSNSAGDQEVTMRLRGDIDASFTPNLADGLPGGDIFVARAGGNDAASRQLAVLGEIDAGIAGDRLFLTPADLGIAGIGRLRIGADFVLPGAGSALTSLVRRMSPGSDPGSESDGDRDGRPDSPVDPFDLSSLMAATVRSVSVDIRDDGGIDLFEAIAGMKPSQMIAALSRNESEGGGPASGGAISDGSGLPGMREMIAGAITEQSTAAMEYVERTGRLSLRIDNEAPVPAAVAALALLTQLDEITKKGGEQDGE